MSPHICRFSHISAPSKASVHPPPPRLLDCFPLLPIHAHSRGTSCGRVPRAPGSSPVSRRYLECHSAQCSGVCTARQPDEHPGAKRIEKHIRRACIRRRPHLLLRRCWRPVAATNTRKLAFDVWRPFPSSAVTPIKETSPPPAPRTPRLTRTGYFLTTAPLFHNGRLPGPAPTPRPLPRTDCPSCRPFPDTLLFLGGQNTDIPSTAAVFSITVRSRGIPVRDSTRQPSCVPPRTASGPASAPPKTVTEKLRESCASRTPYLRGSCPSRIQTFESPVLRHRKITRVLSLSNLIPSRVLSF